MVLTANMLIMVLSAILMLFASIAMIRTGKTPESGENQECVKLKRVNLLKLLVYGIAIGLATGLLGAGGGFLLIPALVLWQVYR